MNINRNTAITSVVGWKLRVFAALVLLVAGSTLNVCLADEAFKGDEGARPYSHRNFQNNPDNFQFAVIGDRAGGHRPGVFQGGMDILNLLQPEFVMSVGDFIEGYVDEDDEDDNETVLRSQWAEMDQRVAVLDMPMFFVQGNHDVNFDPSGSRDTASWQRTLNPPSTVGSSSITCK